MKNKVAFLDRDGTINEDLNYVYKIEDLKILPGAIDGLKKLSKMGYKLIIITNQSGIGRGYYQEKDYHLFMKYLYDILAKEGIIIEKDYFCPHIDSDNCLCRKPKLKMFEDAIKEFNVDESMSIAIGDKKRDLAICENTEIKGFLLGVDYKSINDVANYLLVNGK